MTDDYIRPGDVSPEDAQDILDFINAATSPEELAEEVEIPGERDVGIALGQRILEAGRQLGGFTDLQQVADVRQVGPERFSEIVTNLPKSIGDVLTDSEFIELYNASSFIFRGTVQRIAEVTLALIEPSENTIVVRVDEVFRAPETIMQWANNEITVQLKESSIVDTGQQATFFTNFWMMGESLAVSEVGHYRGDKTLRHQHFSIAARKAVYARLLERVNQATLIVMGTVVELRSADRSQGANADEHDPDWWIATVRIEAVLKGQYRGPVVEVTFANSNDVMWYQAPKFLPHQRGIWLLHRQEVLELPRYSFTALQPIDFHRIEEFLTFRELLA